MPGDVDPRQIQAVGTSDLFSVVDHDNRLHLVDPKQKQVVLANCPHQGSVTGASWMSNDEAWLGIQPNRAILWNRTSGTVVKSLTRRRHPSWICFTTGSPAPLYLVCPKPSSLNGVLQKLLQRDRAGQTQLLKNDLSAFRVEIEIWQPIISNLIFVTVLLYRLHLCLAARDSDRALSSHYLTIQSILVRVDQQTIRAANDTVTTSQCLVTLLSATVRSFFPVPNSHRSNH